MDEIAGEDFGISKRIRNLAPLGLFFALLITLTNQLKLAIFVTCL